VAGGADHAGPDGRVRQVVDAQLRGHGRGRRLRDGEPAHRDVLRRGAGTEPVRARGRRPRLGVVTVVHAIPGRRAPPAPLGAPGYWSLACTAAPRAEKPWRISRYPVRVAHHAAAVWLAATDRSGPENSRSRWGQMVPSANGMA